MKIKCAVINILIAICIASCTSHNSSHIIGKYRKHFSDPAAAMLGAGEDIYIELKEDHHIIYHTTINSKPKFHFNGSYSFDPSSNTINIQWEEGKLPDQLKIEKNEDHYQIKIGETVYIKE